MKAWIGILLAIALFSACKKKVVVEGETATSQHAGVSDAALIPAGDWQGTQDKVDASLGVVKELY